MHSHCVCLFATLTKAEAQVKVSIDNENFNIGVDTKTGAISSFLVKKNNCDLIGEKQLEANFRICLALKDYACNYIDGMEQKPMSVTKNNNVITVVFSGLKSSKGTFPIDLVFSHVRYPFIKSGETLESGCNSETDSGYPPNHEGLCG